MKLSILIVNWNSKEYLRKCLHSLHKNCEDLSPQIVVVDGGSFDGSGEMIAAEFPSVEFVQSPENVGFGRSNNLGFARVTGDAMLLLNPDTEVQPGAIQSMLGSLRYLPEVGIIGPRLLNSDRSYQRGSIHALPTPIWSSLDSDFLRRVMPSAKQWGVVRKKSDMLEVEAVGGACMLLWSKTFRELGGFHPAYFMYAEDMDLCFRVRQLGLHIYHVHSAEILHHGGGSSDTQFSKFSTVMMLEALKTYMELNHGIFSATLFRLSVGFSAVLRIALLAPAWVAGPGVKRSVCSKSLRKWSASLRWTLGLERWTNKYMTKVTRPNPRIASALHEISEQVVSEQ